MRLKISEPSPTELRVVLSLPPGQQFFVSLIGLFFAAIGTAFIFFSLPHTDFLTLDRQGDRVLACKSQALAGRWTLNSARTAFGPNAAAGVVEHEDEGSFFYQTVLEGDVGRWHLGKSVGNRAEPQALADGINRFLADKSARHFEWQKATWWWFMLPFGLGGLAVGLAVMTFGNHQDRWQFNRRSDEAVCRRHFLVWWKTRRWPLRDIRRAYVYRHTDKEGDTFNNVRLELGGGDLVELCTASHQMATTTALEEQVERINRFLGAASQAVQVVDDRGPLPDPAEVEKQIEQLAEKHPRMAGLLRRFVQWAYSKRDRMR
ncbi:MAG: hypothetical protein WCH99_11710 [Verrucomicrobiota bacterium]